MRYIIIIIIIIIIINAKIKVTLNKEMLQGHLSISAYTLYFYKLRSQVYILQPIT